MRKYLTDVYLPAAGLHLNVFLPEEKRIGEVVYLLSGMVEPLCKGTYRSSQDAMLLDAVTGAAYDVTMTVAEAGIRSASRLIFI